MRRLLLAFALPFAATISFGEAARAADPTTADCLAASSASLKASNQHKLRAARSALLTCAAGSCPADIRKECDRRIGEISPQIPTIIFQVKDSSGSDLSGVKVTMDGELLTEGLQGTGLSIDPGVHSFTFEVPGQPLVTKSMLILQSQKDRRELITLPPPPPAAPVSPAPLVASNTKPAGAPPLAPPTPSPLPATNGAPPTSEAAKPTASPTKPDPMKPAASERGTAALGYAGYVTGGLGVVGVVVGGVFGGLAMSAHSKASCSAGRCVDPQSERNAASDGTIADVAIGVGVALAAAGVTMILVDAHTEGGAHVEVAPVASGADFGLSIRGAW